ncbi:ATP-binding protein [Agrobacterium rosae]|uniref:ATP-binding protein n=1 Tax=Agrobacterium rosae TaxID=1972867 RepID=A0ABU4W2E7_9HYPH|nr:ATP-binding protein [Agrobacterium rosae]MDX8331957.1 ATP-binding protein [Agrobacterium rosae]
MDQSLLYDERFLATYAGSIINDPPTAIVELVANAWDAYATDVKISWPNQKDDQGFEIVDNGHGMTRDEFQHIWRTIAYNRIAHGGQKVSPPADVKGEPRQVFGKNGKGRFASFCFADEYLITSRKNGQEFVCRVHRTDIEPLVLDEVSFTPEGVVGHGTKIVGRGSIRSPRLTEEKARETIGSRFLANPAFKVSINGRPIMFSDIPDLISESEVDVDGLGTVKILHIDAKKSDKSTKQHGIAWWVQNRAVGSCKWSGSDYERVLDGRTSEAKRFTFIVKADFLNEKDAILEDWSGFKDDNAVWQVTRMVVQDRIRQLIHDIGKGERQKTKSAVIETHGNSINRLSPVSKERVSSFIEEVVEKCPNFGETEVSQLTGILTKLEQSQSRYGLLELLHNCEPTDYDKLHEILSQWSVGMAKIVLDEIQTRLKLINELRFKTKKVGIDEVHELQPLFERGLWMFGPQFESIEYTSNVGMTKVIQKLFNLPEGRGSRSRPDFVVLPDGSVGVYGRPSFDDEFEQDGIDHVVIIDLKTTGLPLGSKEKDQVWGYVKELRKKGVLGSHVKVNGFVLGDQIASGETETTRHGDTVNIAPMLYSTILARAEKRLLTLHERVKDAPFLAKQREELQRFLEPVEVQQAEMI